MKRAILTFWIFSLTYVISGLHVEAAPAGRISLLVIEGDSFLVNRAINTLPAVHPFQVRLFTYSEIKKNKGAGDFIKGSGIIIVDVMMKELSEYVLNNVDFEKVRVYAVRGSRDDNGLKKRGFVFDREIQDYFRHLSVKNVRNMILKVAHDVLNASVKYAPPDPIPVPGIYHRGSDRIFTGYQDYVQWYRSVGPWKPGAPWIGMQLFSTSIAPGQRSAIDYVTRALEAAGFNVLPCFGKDIDVLRQFFMDRRGKARIDLILAFSLKFYSSLDRELHTTLSDLDVPVINAVNLYSTDIDKWRKDPAGIPPMDVVWTMANPEISGAIEPTPLTGRVRVTDKDSGKVLFVTTPVHDTLDHLIPRIKKWLALRRKKNKEKRVAILFYNHSQGKQKIGASYLNVFRSIELILKRMKRAGYNVGGARQIDESEIKALILKYARNIGSWAPGELERMVRQRDIIQLPITMYASWFEKLPEDFRNNVLRQWGRPEDTSIMASHGKFVIPAVILGNVVLLPEPARGWGDDPMKLYHDPTLYPHHQYIAVYLWLKNVFRADAMIHLGTHATHEWLPGKQAGLSPSCPPEVLITDIPNIYPYIVDDVGEGIQAKRRGRGVIIDHLVPAVKQGGLYSEYSRLYEMISNYNRAVSLGSRTTGGQMKRIMELIQETGILKDLGMDTVGPKGLQKIEHYLLEIKESYMPWGLHTFGVSPDGDALEATVGAILANNPGAGFNGVRKRVMDSGPGEMKSLIRALDGRYIPSGEGNDPLRNISAIPTGRNFYGFEPEKIPSPTAWVLGKKAAEQIIKRKLKEKGTCPQKVAVVLWATETIRNQGVNESTILWLMGLEPVWDRTGRVTGTKVVPGKELGRPRIDVLINPSGLYRDLFPNMVLFLDNAVQQAAVQKDIENLIRQHTEEIRKELIRSGIPEKQADLFSRIRIFTEKPGSYGTGVSEMTGNSGFWDSDDEVVNVYENRVGYAFGLGKWGEDAGEVFRSNLRSVDVAVHSMSSGIYGAMDNDDMFQYLGGLNLAVRREAGNYPDTVVTLQRVPHRVEVESISKTLGRELRARYLNPRWLEGMKKEKYAGAREMADFVEYMWGWQVTVPGAVDSAKWTQAYRVYVNDRYGLGIKKFFNTHNPWAYQSITARMLEAVRKGYWRPGEKIKRKLAVEYALNVVEKGVACCDHTCNNPLLNQMVVNVISLPGVMVPKMVERFKLAIERAMKKRLDQQVRERKSLQKTLAGGFQKRRSDSSPSRKIQSNRAKSTGSASAMEEAVVEGFKMKELSTQDTETEVTSSGVQWFAAFFVALIIAVILFGAKRYK